jgi:hypothetical protein
MPWVQVLSRVVLLITTHSLMSFLAVLIGKYKPHISAALPYLLSLLVKFKLGHVYAEVAGQISETGRCGPAFENAICPFGFCCSG